MFASRSDWAFPADANAVLRAVKRAVATAGCQLQGADDRLLTVYFKSGRTNASASVSAKPDGSSLLTLQGATTALHHQISGEVGRMLTEASTHAERESPRAREADLVAADLDRLAALRRDGLLTEEEFAAAKDRVLASEVAEVESGSTEAEAPIVPKATPITPLLISTGKPHAPVVQGTSVSPPSSGGVETLKSFWRRRSRGAKIAIVIVAVVAILAVIGGVSNTSDRSPSSQTSQGSSGPADEGQDVSESMEMSVWTSAMAVWSNELGSALGDVSDLISSGDYGQLDVPLATIGGCSDNVPPAPSSSDAAQEIEADVLSACGHFESAVDLFTDGINTADVSKINQAAAELTVGNAQIEATTQKIQNVLTP